MRIEDDESSLLPADETTGEEGHVLLIKTFLVNMFSISCQGTHPQF